MRTPDLEILLKRHGFPLYVYDRKAISGRIARLRDIFNGFDILYSKVQQQPRNLPAYGGLRCGH